MNIAIPIVLGVMLALVLAAVAQRRSTQYALRVYAIGLFVAALIYLAFALVGQARGRWLLIEGSGVALFGAAAAVGLRVRPLLLALGWAAHVVWDLALHRIGPGAAYTPAWYPWLCVGFDLTLAAIILTRGVMALHERPARAT